MVDGADQDVDGVFLGVLEGVSSQHFASDSGGGVAAPMGNVDLESLDRNHVRGALLRCGRRRCRVWLRSMGPAAMVSPTFAIGRISRICRADTEWDSNFFTAKHRRFYAFHTQAISRSLHGRGLGGHSVL